MILLAVLLLGAAAVPIPACAQNAWPNYELSKAWHALERIKRAYHAQELEILRSSISKEALFDRFTLENHLSDTFREYSLIYLRFVVRRPPKLENHQAVFKVLWTKKMRENATGRDIYTEGETQLTFDVLMKPQLIKIEGNTPF